MKTIVERHWLHVTRFELQFDDVATPGAGWSFECDKDGNPLLKNPESQENYRKCLTNVDGKIAARGVVDLSRDVLVEAEKVCDARTHRGACGAPALFSRSCGVFVCTDCGQHEHLARCFCGWSASGGNGYAELIEMGERIEDDY